MGFHVSQLLGLRKRCRGVRVNEWRLDIPHPVRDRHGMRRFVGMIGAILLGGACGEPDSVSRYGPFHVKEISNIQISPIDCTQRSDEEIFTDVSFEVVGAAVCTDKDTCGSDYLELDERTYLVPSDPTETDDVLRCEFAFEGEVLGDGEEGTEISLGRMGPDPVTDLGCVISVDTFQLGFVSNPRLVIRRQNQGILLEHEDYAPAQLQVEAALPCQPEE